MLTGVGTLAGLVGSFAMTRVLQGLLFGITATDPRTVAGVVTVLLVVAVAASYLPGRRAMRVEPTVACAAWILPEGRRWQNTGAVCAPYQRPLSRIPAGVQFGKTGQSVHIEAPLPACIHLIRCFGRPETGVFSTIDRVIGSNPKPRSPIPALFLPLFFKHLTTESLFSHTSACDDRDRSERHLASLYFFWNRILMASERQHQANRRNGRKGGPKTETGKQASRRNSLKHGLTSSTLVVLPEENQHEYEAIHCGFRQSFQPHDAAEEALVLRLAQAHWRSLRSRRVETGILNITAATERSRATKIVDDCPEHLSPHNAIAVGFMTGPAERWQAYLRYDTTISRDFFRTLDALTRLQRARQVRKSPALPGLAAAAGAGPVVPTSPSDIAAGQLCAELSDSGIRSVSQNDGVPANCNEPKELAHATKPQTSSESPKRAARTSRQSSLATSKTTVF